MLKFIDHVQEKGKYRNVIRRPRFYMPGLQAKKNREAGAAFDAEDVFTETIDLYLEWVRLKSRPDLDQT